MPTRFYGGDRSKQRPTRPPRHHRGTSRPLAVVSIREKPGPSWGTSPSSSVVVQFEFSTGLAKLPGLWETVGMKKPELTDVGWLGPKDEMDRASHHFGKCSECHEIICVEKAVT